MKIICKTGVILFSLWFLGCGSLTTTTGTTDNTGNTGDTGGTETGTTSTEFQLSGTVSSLNVSPSFSKGTNTSGSVTNVMAISPETGNATCGSTTVDSDGKFKINLERKKPWFLFFYDRFKRGREMFLGRIRSSALDTLTGTDSAEATDLGTVTIDSATGTAAPSKSHANILSGLGLDSDAADTIGNIDDVATRYENPDVDNDGETDCGSSKKYFLDYHVRYNAKVNGTLVTLSDIIGSYLSETDTTMAYTITGVYVAYPKTFSSLDTGSVTFEDSAVTTEEGGAIPANTATSKVTTNNFGDYNGFGPNISTTSELPSGDIIFKVGTKELTFSGVKTPKLSELTAPTGRIFPFLKLNKTDSTCTSNCTLASISYKWMKKTSTGWTAAAQTELDLLAASKGGTLSLRVDNSSSKTVSMTIPVTSTSGSIDWTSANASLSGVTATEFTSLVTTQLCHIGLSYDDKLGMRYFEGISDTTGTCSGGS